jgi:hypothetical protein
MEAQQFESLLELMGEEIVVFEYPEDAQVIDDAQP